MRKVYTGRSRQTATSLILPFNDIYNNKIRKMNNWLKTSKAKLLKEQSGDNQFTAEVTVDIVFDEDAVYEGRQLKYRFYSNVTTMKVNYLIDMELRSWGLKSVTVYAPSGEPDIEFNIELVTGERDTETITFKGVIDWSKVDIEREDDEEGFLINPHTIELQYDKNCKFDQGTVMY